MDDARTQAQAVGLLLVGRPVRYRGHEIPAPPEGQRSHRKARAWLLEHTGPLARGPEPSDEDLVTVAARVPATVAEEIERRAETQGTSSSAVAREAIVRGLNRLGCKGKS